MIMKRLLPVIVFFAFLSVCSAITLDEIVKLTQLKTSDDLIIQLIQNSPIDKKITSQDIVYLKEQGVSDAVLDYVGKASHPDTEKMPLQSESKMVEKTLRAYTTT